jgi:hypothetical protein
MYTWHWWSIARWSNIHETNLQESVIYISPDFAPRGPGLPHCWCFEITLRHTTFGKTPLGVGSAYWKDLYLHKTGFSPRTDIHSAGCIRTHCPTKRAAADPRLKPRSFCVCHIPYTESLFRLTTGICHFPACSFAALTQPVRPTAYRLGREAPRIGKGYF